MPYKEVIRTPKGRIEVVTFQQPPTDAARKAAAQAIDARYDAMLDAKWKQQPAPQPQPQPQQPEEGGWLEKAITAAAHWFMNSPIGRWLASSPTPIAPGGPVGREITPPQKPTPKPQPKAAAKTPPSGSAKQQAATRQQQLQPNWKDIQTPFGPGVSAFDPNNMGLQPLTEEQWRQIEAESLRQRQLNLLDALHTALSIPFRVGVSAVGATLPGRVYGVEAGRPTILTGDWQQRFFQMYSNPETEWGAVLEKDAPFLPRIVRQGLAIPMDIYLDPANLIPFGKGIELLGKLPAVERAALKARALAGAAMNPSAMKAAAAIAQNVDRPGLLDVLRFAWGSPEEANKAVEWAARMRNLAAQDPDNVPKWINILGTDKTNADKVVALATRNPQAIKQARQALEDSTGGLSDAMLEYARAIEDLGAEEILKLSPFQLQEMGYNVIPQETIPQPLTPAAAAGLREAYRLEQELFANPNVAQQALGLWKFMKTAGNFPASADRNFYQNFILSWLAGDPITPGGVARGLWDVLFNWREPWRRAGASTARATESGMDVLSRSPLKRFLIDRIGQLYQLADEKAASALSKATGLDRETFLMQHQYLPETAAILSRWGILPFISWYLYAAPRWAKGLIRNPARTRSYLLAMKSMQPDNVDDLETIQIHGSTRKRDDWGDILPSESMVGTWLPLDPSEFVGEEGSWLPFIRQNPFIQLALGGYDALSGGGVRGAFHTSTGSGPIDLMKFLWYFTTPSTVSKYTPELIRPIRSEDYPWLSYTPRDRVDALLSLLGISSVPADTRAKLNREQKQQKDVERLQSRTRWR